MKITVYGDSIAKGLYLDAGTIKRIERSAVSMISQRLGVQITNNSLFGQTLQRFENRHTLTDYLETLKPNEENIFILSLGGNDADYRWDEVELTPNENHGSFTNPQSFYKMLNDLLITLKDHQVKVYLTSLFPIDSNRYFQNVISKKHDGAAILSFLKNDVNNLYRHHEQFNNLVTRCARENNCPFIDFRTPLLQKNDLLDYLSLDGIHPNQKGHEFIADIICQYFQPTDKLIKE